MFPWSVEATKKHSIAAGMSQSEPRRKRPMAYFRIKKVNETITIVGGTGAEGIALALRFARAGAHGATHLVLTVVWGPGATRAAPARLVRSGLAYAAAN